MTEDDKQSVRRRATAILIRNDRVLLLREPQDTAFHLPGGGVEQGELPISGVVRELHEETGLSASTSVTCSTTTRIGARMAFTFRARTAAFSGSRLTARSD